MVKNNTDRREFARFQIEFEIEVTLQDKTGNRLQEKATLVDISGGGAKFITQQADRYFPGQVLEVIVHLPGTDDMKAYMKGEARVVRIDSLELSGLKGEKKEMVVAVNMDIPLRFERVNTKA